MQFKQPTRADSLLQLPSITSAVLSVEAGIVHTSGASSYSQPPTIGLCYCSHQGWAMLYLEAVFINAVFWFVRGQRRIVIQPLIGEAELV